MFKILLIAILSSFVLQFYRTSTMISRKVLKSILSVEQGEGMGARVRRSIGTMQLKNLDPFIMLDEFAVKPPAGFPDHPHRGFETVTYMLTGKFKHEDFAGHAGTIGPGDLQWMTAGKGIVHAEMPASNESATGLQLWVNLAKKEKLCEPSYQELLDKDIPHAKPEEGIDIKVIAGESFGVTSKVYTKTPTMYLDFKLAANKHVKQQIPAGWTCFIYSLNGKAQFGQEKKLLDAHHTIVFESMDKESVVEVETTQDGPVHFVLIAGKPIGEPVYQHGPFVMTTREEIEQAFQDYSYGTNGFERALTWESKIGKMRYTDQ